ncbi:hypothetical protein [Gulosibacter hominis]|uniref:hypothetical protein n=1 Tax=Gulosibacter hominis TaxID=2770504 RepID=UPI001918DAC8|nr:hypothetical protein [Gulosibacter hominis]
MTPLASEPVSQSQAGGAVLLPVVENYLDTAAAAADSDDAEQLSGFARQIDRALAVQRPLAIAFVRRWRRKYPEAAPADLLPVAERWFRRSAMGTGGGVGAAAIVPGVGTATGIAIAAAEVLIFVELTALFVMTMAEIHGDATDDPRRARTLVMALLLGDKGKRIIREVAAGQDARGLFKSAVWGELVTRTLPDTAVNEIGRRLREAFFKRFGQRQIGGIVGKVLPFGVGATVGALGNRALANEVISNAKTAFGAPPAKFVGPVSDEVLQAVQAERDERLLERATRRAERRAVAARRLAEKRARRDAAKERVESDGRKFSLSLRRRSGRKPQAPVPPADGE